VLSVGWFVAMSVGEWFSGLLDAGPLPTLALGLAAIFALFASILVPLRAPTGAARERLLRISLIVLVVAVGYWLVDRSIRRDITGEQQALDARAFELVARALVPGSPLACLAGPIGEMVEEACEGTLFATPETTAAAVSYVAAQLSLLADARDRARRGGANYGSALTNLRRMIEADRFGIVAHVLATRDGCTPKQCAAFGFLQGPGRVSANLAERTFETHVNTHMAAWQSAGARAAGSVSSPGVGPTASVLPTKPASSPLFPSSATTPQVNIMAAEPLASQPSRDAAAEPRKPSSAGASPAQPSSPKAGAAASVPLQLAPNAQ